MGETPEVDDQTSKRVHEKELIIGPFLGPGKDDEINIIISLPYSDVKKLSCKLVTGDFSKTVTVEGKNYPYNVFKFNFNKLQSNVSYKYSFVIESGELLDLQDIGYDDCEFTLPSLDKDSDSFILLSCNNPFTYEENGWAMWERLYDNVKDDSSIQLILLAGDQVYCDDIEIEFAKRRTKSTNIVEQKEFLTKRFIEQYHKYWSHPALRKVMARVPSLAMWDDHDITDGWGGREDLLDEKSLPNYWKTYFSVAREAFSNYQAIRNPPSIVSGQSFTTFYDLNDLRVYLFDFRSEKDSVARILWSKDHEKETLNSISTIPSEIQNVFLLTPVIAVRTDPKEDEELSEASKALYSDYIQALKYFEGENKVWYKTIYHNVMLWLAKKKDIAFLSDDIQDALCSKVNKESFIRLLHAVYSLLESGRSVGFLSGDIHTAGIAELLIKTKDPETLFSVPQIVSSPIAYAPMNPRIEGATTCSKEIEIYNDEQKNYCARNIAYFPQRNFAKIFPKRIQNNQSGGVQFYIEDHSEPICMPVKFTKKTF